MGRSNSCVCIEKNPNSDCCRCVCESEIKLFRKIALSRFNSRSTGDFVNDLTVKLPFAYVGRDVP